MFLIYSTKSFGEKSGIKYAITKEATSKKPQAPIPGDIVAIDYTGYLSNGQVSRKNV